jgi:hypothetical protein
MHGFNGGQRADRARGYIAHFYRQGLESGRDILDSIRDDRGKGRECYSAVVQNTVDGSGLVEPE